MSAHRRSWAIWRWPVFLAALTVFGLLSALLGQGGMWWVMSWVALATPLAVASVSVVRRQRPDGSLAR